MRISTRKGCTVAKHATLYCTWGSGVHVCSSWNLRYPPHPLPGVSSTRRLSGTQHVRCTHPDRLPGTSGSWYAHYPISPCTNTIPCSVHEVLEYMSVLHETFVTWLTHYPVCLLPRSSGTRNVRCTHPDRLPGTSGSRYAHYPIIPCTKKYWCYIELYINELFS